MISSSTPISHNFPGIAASAREKAQDQYRRVLEKTLGSPDDVLPTYRAWLHVIESESGSEELNADDAALADRWIKASNLARQAAFRTLGHADAAYFEVKLGWMIKQCDLGKPSWTGHARHGR